MKGKSLLINPALLAKIQQCHCDWSVDTASNLIAAFPQDVKAKVLHLDGAVFTRNEVKPPMNQLFFIDPSFANHLDDILDSCKQENASFRVGIHPYMGIDELHLNSGSGLIVKLIEKGFVYDNQVFTWIRSTEKSDFDNINELEVVRYGEDQLEEYFSIWFRGNSLLDDCSWLENEIALFRSPNWFRYIFFDRGKPAATSIGYHNGEIYACFYHETLKPFRRRGLQQQSLQLRSKDAHDLGCKFIIGSTQASNLQSQRNFHRSGFQLACNWSFLNWRS